MQKVNSLVPKLRFSEFEGEWNYADLSNLTNKVSIKNKDELDYPIYSISNENGFVPQGEQFSGLDSNERGYDTSMYKIVGKNTFAYNPARINVGSIGYSENLENVIISSLYVCFTTNEDVDDKLFLYYFKTGKFLKEVAKKVEGGVRDYLFYNNFGSIKYFYSTLPEQQKIATFITAIDNRLQTLEKKKTLLKQYKKGIMQKIFKQELRFKDEDGNAYPDWEFKNGNLLFKSISDKNHNSDLPILAITQDQGAIPRHLINYNIGVSVKSVSSYKVVQVGDFIISLRSFQGGIEYSNYKGICSPAYIILKPIDELDRTFYKYYLKTSNYIQELTRKLEGIRDGKMISYKYFSEIKLPYPSVKEQTKIANFLSAIDKNIALVNTKIEHTKAYKKGLLQQMFV
ncbi:restriction endonuclease subunit S [Tenacibaculum maritimum]|uniref:restriction endonuclease subunit S n=1 Tax=Tenacibaculum maritimum TaxID=107401 RepID=UPI003875BD57